MKKNIGVLSTLSLLLFIQDSAFAAPPRGTRVVAPSTANAYEEEPVAERTNPWQLFLGADLGISNYSAYNSSLTEAARSGSHLGVRALLAHYWPEWVLDGGLGWQVINNSGTNTDGSRNKVSTRNGFVDLSPRYRFNEHWQLGPEFQYWLGTDKGLNPTLAGTDTITEVDNTSAWGGLQLAYEWYSGNTFRVGGRWLTDLNTESRSVNVFQAFFQIGFGIFGSGDNVDRKRPVYEQVNEGDLDRAGDRTNYDPLPMTTPAEKPWDNPEVLTTPAPPEPELAPEKENPPRVILTLDVNDLPFGFNDANLPAANANRVRKIGQFLKANNGTWKKLVVSGHTDERGSKVYNDRLSKRRADTVRKLLIEGGASGPKISSIGYGESKPLDRRSNEKAWAKNRRVELEFRGVKDVVLMKKAMSH